MEPEQVTQMLVIDQGKLSQGQVSLCKKRVASQVKLALGQCSFLRVLAGERSTREILSKPVPFSRSRNWRSFIDPASGRAVVQGHVIRSGLSNLGRGLAPRFLLRRTALCGLGPQSLHLEGSFPLYGVLL